MFTLFNLHEIECVPIPLLHCYASTRYFTASFFVFLVAFIFWLAIVFVSLIVYADDQANWRNKSQKCIFMNFSYDLNSCAMQCCLFALALSFITTKLWSNGNDVTHTHYFNFPSRISTCSAVCTRFFSSNSISNRFLLANTPAYE